MTAPLIDAIVRKTARLIAGLAIEGPTLAPLAHLPDLFFESLVTELGESHDLPRRVVADSIGLSVRALQGRLKHPPSRARRGDSLATAVYGHLNAHGPTTRGELEKRFARDDINLLRSVLRRMVDDNVLLSGGRGYRATYQINPLATLDRNQPELFCHLIWVALYETPGATRQMLARALGLGTNPDDLELVEDALATLYRQAQVRREGERYWAVDFTFEPSRPEARDAAIFDHFSVIVEALLAGATASRGEGSSGGAGGATYRFDLYRDDPISEQALGLLDELRARLSSLRRMIDEQERDDRPIGQVLVYLGQATMLHGSASESD